MQHVRPSRPPSALPRALSDLPEATSSEQEPARVPVMSEVPVVKAADGIMAVAEEVSQDGVGRQDSMIMVRQHWRQARIRAKVFTSMRDPSGRLAEGFGSIPLSLGAVVNSTRSSHWQVARDRWREAAPGSPGSPSVSAKAAAKARWASVLEGIREKPAATKLQSEEIEREHFGIEDEGDGRPIRQQASAPHGHHNCWASIAESIPHTDRFGSSGPGPCNQTTPAGRGGILSSRRAFALAAALRALGVLLPPATLVLLLCADFAGESSSAEWCNEHNVLCFDPHLLAKFTSGLSAFVAVLLEVFIRRRGCCSRLAGTVSKEDAAVGALSFALAVSMASPSDMRKVALAAEARELAVLQELLPLARELIGAQADEAERLARVFVKDPHATEMAHWSRGAAEGNPSESRRAPDSRRPDCEPRLVRKGSSLAMALEAASTVGRHRSNSKRESSKASGRSMQQVQLADGTAHFSLDTADLACRKPHRKLSIKRARTTGHGIEDSMSSLSTLRSHGAFDGGYLHSNSPKGSPKHFNGEQQPSYLTEAAGGQAQDRDSMPTRKLQHAPNGNPVRFVIDNEFKDSLVDWDEEGAMTYRSEGVPPGAEAKKCEAQLLLNQNNYDDSDPECIKIEFMSSCLRTQNAWLSYKLHAMQDELQNVKNQLNHSADLHQDQIEILRGFRKIISRTFDDWQAAPVVEVHIFEDRDGLRAELEETCKLLEINCESCSDTAKAEQLLLELAQAQKKVEKNKAVGALDSVAGSENRFGSYCSQLVESPVKVVFLGALFLSCMPPQWNAENLFVALVSEAEEFEELGAALSASDEGEVRSRLKSRGIGEYLLYPVSQSTVEEMVRSALQHQFGAEYLLVRPLGRGTMGVVYHAKRVSDGDVFALKEINTRRYNRQGQGDIIRQLESLQTLAWPTIVSVLDYWMATKDQLLYCLMPLLSGGSLERHIEAAREDGEPITGNLVEKWYAQTLHGLSYLHWHGMLHRDIKPDNLLTDGDRSILLKIGDLGSTMRLPGPGPHPSPGSFVEASVTTPGYTGPEVHNSRRYSAGSDLWSVGATFYEVVTLETLLPVPESDTPGHVIAELVSSFDPSSLEVNANDSMDEGGLVADLPELLRSDPVARPDAAELAARPATSRILRSVLEEQHFVPSDHFDDIASIRRVGQQTLADPNPASWGDTPLDVCNSHDVSDGEVTPRAPPAAAVENTHCSSCGNKYMEDSRFCRICGLRRKTTTFLSDTFNFASNPPEAFGSNAFGSNVYGGSRRPSKASRKPSKLAV